MNRLRLTIIAALAALPLVTGCASKTGGGIDMAKGFGVDVGFKAVDMCQNVSPEMRIRNIPPRPRSST